MRHWQTLTALVISTVLLTAAEMKMSVEQLRSFIKSSRQLNHPDRQVSDFLKQVKMTERLDERTVEELQGLGAGPRTTAVLKSLAESSTGMPAPNAPVASAPARPTIPPPSPEEQMEVLKNVTEWALDYAKRLPNFICTQVTRRYADPTGMEFFRLQDTITAKLTFFEQKENYQVVLVNNQFINTNMERLGGATSTGEFGSLLKEVFDPESQTRFEWTRWGTLRGKRMHVFSYQVAQQNSKWSIVYEKSERIVPGYHGLIFVDHDTMAVMRITLEADIRPFSFPVQTARTVLDYEWQEIAGQQYVLPLRASVAMRASKLMTRNDVEFRLYKRFGAEATITLTPDPLPDSQVTEEKP
ncbi:MAG TPA: hypothetical protein VE621_21040 [Bryobacteraceae bacterium]|jgi:hypothetical protein|nr:hypothetical protein [Bryobacteraceae bacterium]